MTNSAALFQDCFFRFFRARQALMDKMLPRLPSAPYGSPYTDGLFEVDLASVLAVAPVVETEGQFEVMTAPRPPKTAWRVLLAVRAGVHDPDWSREGIARTVYRSTWYGEMVDILACAPDLCSVSSRATRAATVIGWPQDPDMVDRPIRLHETPWAWLADGGHGVCLGGDDLDNQWWLRRCSRGVTAGGLPFAEAVDAKLRRAGVGSPKVWVREAA